MAVWTQTNKTTFNSSANSASYAITLGWTATAGRLMVVALNCDDILGSPAVSDNINTTGTNWSQATTASNNTIGAIYYKLAQGGETTVTLKVSAAFPEQAVIFEYSGNVGASPLDLANSLTGTSLSPSSPAITTTGAQDLLIGIIGSDFTSSVTYSAVTSGYTTEGNLATTGGSPNDFAVVVSNAGVAGAGVAAGSQSFGATQSANVPWVACIAAFKGVVASTAPVGRLISEMQNTSGLINLVAVRQALPW